MILLVLFIIALVAYGLLEHRRHSIALKRIPLRIHVNGTRGKSSVTRLIAAGLRAGGVRTVAKVTGTRATLILPEGEERPIDRLGKPNIRENLSIVREAARHDAEMLILECMAIDPELQRFTEREIVQSRVGVITNVRPDHQEVMGYSLEEVARSLAGTMPREGILFTAEDRYFPILEERGRMMGTRVVKVTPDIDEASMDRFRYLEHRENVALGLEVCRYLGVPPDVALEGMVQTPPDPGALNVFTHAGETATIHFVNAFAANDPDSIARIWARLSGKMEGYDDVSLLLNLRKDRIYRSSALSRLISSTFTVDGIFLVGDYTSTVAMNLASKGVPESMIHRLSPDSVGNMIREIERRSTHGRVLLFGLGNMGGWGHRIVDFFREEGEQIDCRSDRSWPAF